MRTLQQIKDNSREKDIVFFYDSLLPKFLGTRVCCYYQMLNFCVIAKETFISIFDIGENRVIQKQNKKTIYGYFDTSSSLSEDNPFNVKVITYCPVKDKQYVFDVLNIFVTNQKQISNVKSYEFIAANLIDWREID